MSTVNSALRKVHSTEMSLLETGYGWTWWSHLKKKEREKIKPNKVEKIIKKVRILSWEMKENLMKYLDGMG